MKIEIFNQKFRNGMFDWVSEFKTKNIWWNSSNWELCYQLLIQYSSTLTDNQKWNKGKKYLKLKKKDRLADILYWWTFRTEDISSWWWNRKRSHGKIEKDLFMKYKKIWWWNEKNILWWKRKRSHDEIGKDLLMKHKKIW